MGWIRQEEVPFGNVIKIMSINESAMKAVQAVNQAVTFGASALTRVQEEAIATAVSVVNKCRY
jgi:alkylhydroperoxidase family enzyme